jgi:hypothetical protein
MIPCPNRRSCLAYVSSARFSLRRQTGQDIAMVKRPKPYDPFIARMEAKRQAEWAARLARETTDEKRTALGWKEPIQKSDNITGDSCSMEPQNEPGAPLPSHGGEDRFS